MDVKSRELERRTKAFALRILRPVTGSNCARRLASGMPQTSDGC
jgi:hypothetical protein